MYKVATNKHQFAPCIKAGRACNESACKQEVKQVSLGDENEHREKTREHRMHVQKVLLARGLGRHLAVHYTTPGGAGGAWRGTGTVFVLRNVRLLPARTVALTYCW